MFSNEETDDFIKIVKSLENTDLSIKFVSETAENKVIEQRRGILGMLAATLGARLLGNVFAGKGVIRADEGTNKVGQDFWCRLIL